MNRLRFSSWLLLYDWDLSTYHWPLNGFGLNDRILKKVYSGNAQKILERRIAIKP